MDELAKRFADLAEKYGPAVFDAAKEAARVEAYSSLRTSIFVLAAGAALILIARWIWSLEIKDSFDRGPARGLAGLLGVIGLLISIAAVAQIADPWLWTTFSNPELWIAKKTLGL